MKTGYPLSSAPIGYVVELNCLCLARVVEQQGSTIQVLPVIIHPTCSRFHKLGEPRHYGMYEHVYPSSVEDYQAVYKKEESTT